MAFLVAFLALGVDSFFGAALAALAAFGDGFFTALACFCSGLVCLAAALALVFVVFFDGITFFAPAHPSQILGTNRPRALRTAN